MELITSSAEERREEILDILTKEKKIKVADIKQMFNVSSVTANNDLIYLEKKGLIERQFGYAVVKENTVRLIDESNVENLDKKKELAKCAVDYFSNNESVFFYTGSTVYQLAKCVAPELSLIVVTNSILIANELSEKPNIKNILLGGFYNPEAYATYGEQAIKQLNEYNIDKLFISINGVSVTDGATIDEPFEAELNRVLIKNAKKVIVLADSTKIGSRRFISVADVADIDVLITNRDADEEEIKKIKDKGVSVVLV